MPTAKATIEELIRRQEAGDEALLYDLVAVVFVNHAAGPQGRDGLRQNLQTIDRDLGPVRFEQHHLVADDDVVCSTSPSTARIEGRPCHSSPTSP